jgi:hypothetical protein
VFGGSGLDFFSEVPATFPQPALDDPAKFKSTHPMHMRLCRWLLLGLFLAPSTPGAERVFHVSPQGSDTHPGSRSQPFATLEKARAAVRQAGREIPRRVIVAAGQYERRETFQLGPEDSGTAGAPVTWEAAQGECVRLTGGTTVPAAAFQPVTDPGLLQRLDPAARGQVRVADLQALGVGALAEFPTAYHGAPPGPELYQGGGRLRIACWPNQGWATVARIIESGSRPRDGDRRGLTGTFEYGDDRPSRWRAEDGIWLQGYWCYDWYDEVIKVRAIAAATRRITLAVPHVYGLQQGNPSPRRFRALNVLEELDEPGEFVLDHARGRLYLWPAAGRAGEPVTLATLDAPIIRLQDAACITLRGFAVECGLDNGIDLEGGADCAIEACAVSNLRRLGIRVAGGRRHRVADCDLHDTGTGGLVLGGGDRKTLTPAGHEAVNNHIWRFSVHQLTSAYGLSFEGVGQRAAHNLIHDAPHQAIFVGGNDHVFEYNEVHRVCTETDDCGALYKGRNPSCRGNVIRWNYWHDIGNAMGHGSAAVYFDDGDGGDLVLGNVFVRCGDPGRGSFGTVFSHGGHGLRAEQNMFIDCRRALGSAPWNDARWRAALKGAEETFFPEKLLQEVDITRPPYLTRYPELAHFMDPPPEAPRENRARLNLMVRCGEISGGNWRMEEGLVWATPADPGFVNAAQGDYRLRPDSEVLRRLPGFQPPPLDQMGLRGAGSRRAWPLFHPVPPAANARPTEPSTTNVK